MLEFSSLLVGMKPDAQCAVAVCLRRAIWNWIETFPSEFIEMCNGYRKLDGAPERVFDLLTQIENDQNRKILWPTLCALLMLSHERLKQVSLQFDPHLRNKLSQSKKVRPFLTARHVLFLRFICVFDFRNWFSWTDCRRTCLRRRNLRKQPCCVTLT